MKYFKPKKQKEDKPKNIFIQLIKNKEIFTEQQRLEVFQKIWEANLDG